MKRLTIGLVGIAVLAGLAVYPVASSQIKSSQHVAVAEEASPPIGSDEDCECSPPIEPAPPEDCDCAPPIEVPPAERERELPDLDKQGAIRVIKFKDANGNGIEDSGEPRMSGVTFHLNEGETDHRIAATNSAGEILWHEVAVGSHLVREEVPSGFVVTTPNPQTALVGHGTTVVLKFGNRPVIVPQRAVLEIIKFKDADGDGVRDSGEPGMSGVFFALKLEGREFRTGTTNEAGILDFNDLDSGTYTAIETVPDGFRVTTANPQTVTLSENDHKTLLFGNQPIVQPKEKKAAIKVIKFKDDNGNGKMDSGEGRFSGVQFTVNGGMMKPTDGNGEALWVDLALGSYQVSEGIPAGFTPTTPTVQTAVLDENGETVTLFFGNKSVAAPKELPPTGAMEVFLPTSVGLVGSLYALVKRQRKYTIDLLRNL